MSKTTSLLSICAFCLLTLIGGLSCTPKHRVIASNEQVEKASLPDPPIETQTMTFVEIPESGDEWKDECLRRGIEHKPVGKFYLQARQVSIAQYRDSGGDVGWCTGVPELFEWSDGYNCSDDLLAVKWAESLSNRDKKYNYKLPTPYEWLYAHHCVKTLNRRGMAPLNFAFERIAWEFAAEKTFDRNLASDGKAESTQEKTIFIMGYPDTTYSEPKAENPVPQRLWREGVPDGQDESTYLRLVREQKPQ